jgi:putative phosphoesterase
MLPASASMSTVACSQFEMRIGLIADIHGNLVALDLILAELDRASVEQILCLGDLAVLGPQPGEVIDQIRERGIRTVCGNTDAWLVPDHPIPVVPPDSRESMDLTAWTASRLGPEQIEYLRNLPVTMSVPIDESRSLLCFHATPSSLDDITHCAKPVGVGEQGSDRLMCCGHTHIQAAWRVDQQLWINPGSVGLPGVGPGDPGLPQNRNVTWVEYGVLDIDDRQTALKLHRLELDVESMWQAVRESDMPHQAWWRMCWST